jgi:hypothetical protein
MGRVLANEPDHQLQKPKSIEQKVGLVATPARFPAIAINCGKLDCVNRLP